MKLQVLLLFFSIAILAANAKPEALPAIRFDQPNGGFFHTNLDALSTPTIALWVNAQTTSPPSERQVIFYLGEIGVNGIGLWLHEKTGNLVIGVGTFFFQTTVSLTPNRWTFVQLSTSPYLTLYIDGNVAAQQTTVIYTPATTLYIGSGSVNLYPFYGGIDEVQVWERVDHDNAVFRWQMMVGFIDGFTPLLLRHYDCELQYLGFSSIMDRRSGQMVPVSGNVVQSSRETYQISVCPFYSNCTACLDTGCSWCSDTSNCIERGARCSVGMTSLTCASPNTTNMIIVIATTCGTAVLVVVVVVPAVVVTKLKQKRKNQSIKLATLLRTEPRDERELVVYKDDHTFAGARNWIVVNEHAAEDEFELSLKRGEKVFLLSAENKLFWIVQSATSQVGLVPKEILSPSSD